MTDLNRALTLLKPPPWLGLALAAVLAVVLLTAFVDALQQNVRRGEEMRQGQRVGAVRQTAGPMGHAAPGAQAQRLGTSTSPNFQR